MTTKALIYFAESNVSVVKVFDGSPEHVLPILETLVARMASEREFEAWAKVDTLFHLALADASGSKRLLAEITDVRAEAYRLSLSVPEPRATFDLSNDEHRAILNAVAGRRPERARQAVYEHVRSTLALWLGLGLVRDHDVGEARPHERRRR